MSLEKLYSYQDHCNPYHLIVARIIRSDSFVYFPRTGNVQLCPHSIVIDVILIGFKPAENFLGEFEGSAIGS